MKLVHKVMTSLAILSLSSVAGCGPGEQSCTDIGCVDGVQIELTKLISKYMTQLPLTVKVCTGAGGTSCVTFTVKPVTGQPPLCEAPAMANVSCTLGAVPDVSLEIVVPPSQTDVAAGKVDVHVTVTDAMSMVLFDQTTTGTIMTTMPNGTSCSPVCHEATIAFTP